jgi:hypothetical protein
MAKNIEVTLTLNSRQFDRGVKSAKGSISSIKTSAGGAGGAFAGLAGKLAIAGTAFLALKKAVDGVGASIGAARQIEDIGVVLKNVVGSAEGGALALQQVRDIAQELPFAFEEIAGATPALATVSKDLNELEENTRLAADIAAVTGLSFQDASGQLQRALSAGAGAADMFREKGVLAMAGFEAGASYSIEETRRKLKEFGESIDGAANDLNVTLTGALSQAGDRFFNFQAEMGNAINPEFTAFINQIVKIFDENKETVTAFAKTIGEGVVNAFYTVLEVGAVLVDYFTMLFNALKSVATFVNEKFGDVFYTVFNSVAKIIGGVVEAVAFLGKGIGRLIELAGGSNDVTQFFENIQNAANKVRTGGLEKFSEAMDDVFTAVPVTTAQDFVARLIETMQAAGIAADEETQKILDKISGTVDAGSTTIKNGAKGISSSLADYQTAQENILSVAAQSFDRLSMDMATTLLEGGNMMDNFKNMFKTIVKQMIAEAIKLAVIKPILDSIFGVFGFGVSLDGGKFSISKLTNPEAKAKGGPVMRNKPYVVGELGPELFVPTTGGSIVPNNQLMGGSQVTYNINAVDAPSFQQLVARDPEFIFSVTEAGRRRIPGRL